jgi:hypothetical protein
MINLIRILGAPVGVGVLSQALGLQAFTRQYEQYDIVYKDVFNIRQIVGLICSKLFAH